MTKNIGSTDRIIRLLVAVGVGALYFTNSISGTLAVVLGIVALVLVATSVVGFCPLFKLLNISTLKKESA